MGGADEHWVTWHQAYEDPASPLNRRLAAVQRRITDALDAAPPGPIRVVSICSGQGRDLIGAVAGHQRRADVTARLVELDPRLVRDAAGMAQDAGLDRVVPVEGDASACAAYAGAVPADVVLVCGVFGNISEADIRSTIAELPHLCAPGATVVWTRHRRAPDLTPMIRGWFTELGFDEVGFDSEEGQAFGVGTNRMTVEPQPLRPGVQLFHFVGDGTDAHF